MCAWGIRKLMRPAFAQSICRHLQEMLEEIFRASGFVFAYLQHYKDTAKKNLPEEKSWRFLQFKRKRTVSIMASVHTKRVHRNSQ